MMAITAEIIGEGWFGRANLRRLVGFSGRMRRSHYWLLNIFLGILSLCLTIAALFAAESAGATGTILWTVTRVMLVLVVAWLSLAAIVRRLHDLGLPGSWILISIPVNFVVTIGLGADDASFPVRQVITAVLVLLVGLLDGSVGPNRFGPDPRGRDSSSSGAGFVRAAAERVDRWTAAGLALISVIGLLAVQLALPLAQLLPRTFTTRVGERLVSNAVPAMYRCKALDSGAALERLAASLDPGVSAHVHVTSHPYVNGLAFPGGSILLGQDVVRSAQTPEEIAALMAHELAHIRLMHAERALVSQLAFSALPGSLSSIFNAGWGLAYSQRQEREADAMAIQTMVRAGIDPGHFASLLKRLEQDRARKQRGERAAAASWLATHPSLPERLASIERAKAPAVVRPPMTEMDWVDVHIACS